MRSLPHALLLLVQATLGLTLVLGVFPPFLFDLSAQISESNVLVLYNADQGVSGDGFQIADYYQQVRPGVHLAGISGIDSILSGAFQEEVSAEDYLNVIRPQVLSAIGAIPDSIDVIVTTKGLPLRITAGSQPVDDDSLLWREWSSLESELARIDSIDEVEDMGDQFILTGFPEFDTTLASNPYYNSGLPFVRAGSDPVNGDIRLSSRLDGYSVDTVKSAIDRAQNVYIAPQGQFIIADDDPTAGTDQMINNIPGGPGPGLLVVAASKNQAILYDNTDSAITSADGPVIGYVSHGTNDGAGGLDKGYIQNELQFDLANGAVFLTHESNNATSFDPAKVQTQGLVAEWLEAGGTAGLGHAWEPLNGPDNVTNEDLLFQFLLPDAGAQPGETGLTFVEAAWGATRQLSYVNTVVGDPLMRFQVWLPSDANFDGEVEFDDFFILQGNWLQSGGVADGDFTGDGIVDMADFQILQSNWLSGATASVVAPGGTIVSPIIDAETGEPTLFAVLTAEANFDGDLDVDDNDRNTWEMAFGNNSAGDTDYDGDTDGFDFLTWQQQYATFSLPADFNIDLITDTGDVSIWEASFSANTGGDVDGDGDTDGADFLALQRELDFSTATSPASGVFSPAVQGGANAIVIPEPTSLVLMLGSLALLLHRKF